MSVTLGRQATFVRIAGLLLDETLDIRQPRFSHLAGLIRAPRLRLSFGNRDVPELAFLRERQLSGQQGILLLHKGGLRHGQAPDLGKRLPHVRRYGGQREYLAQSRGERAAPCVQHAGHGIGRARAESRPNLLDCRRLAGGHQRVGGSADL